MLTIRIPNNFLAERTYAVEVMFRDFLGLPFKIVPSAQVRDYTIEANGRCLVVQDHFFGLFDEKAGYLDSRNIPQAVTFASIPFAGEIDLPILFGHPTVDASTGHILCGIDLFAGLFFMLSRWEENVLEVRDTHGRFPAAASLAGKCKFLHRPVVNEYAEILHRMLIHLNLAGSRSQNRFRLVLTHDVDRLWVWKNSGQFFRTLIGDLLRRKSPAQALHRLSEYRMVARGKENLRRVFPWLMNLSESKGQQARFYFSASDGREPDPAYRIRSRPVQALIQQIRSRGHLIGFHAGYHTFGNPGRWQAERRRLEKSTGMSVSEGRQHYLRFAVPDTWQTWEDNGMEIDSSCGYPDHDGFRCGTGDLFPVFNIRSRRKLRLKELPLVVMDATLKEYRGLDTGASWVLLSIYIQQARRYQMPLTMLLHNHVFYDYEKEWSGWREIVERLI